MSNEEIKFGPQSDLSIFTGTMVEMTWTEVEESAKRGDIVLFPIAVVEEHGPHMDLSPDIYMAYLFSRYLRQNLEKKGIRAVIAPPYYWGINSNTLKYPGTFTVRPETFKAVLFDIFSCLKAWEFSKVFIINSHGDRKHTGAISQAIEQIRADLNMQVHDLSCFDMPVENPPVFQPQREGKFEPDYHAGANETAAMWAFYPQKVKADIAKDLKPQDTFDPLGYCGDPANFDLEESLIENYKADVELDSLKIQAFLRKKL